MAAPHIKTRAALTQIRHYECTTKELVDTPRIWSAIEHVAAALVRRRRLSHDAVVRLLGPSFFAEVKAVRLLGVN